jgi:hypothetical protein
VAELCTGKFIVAPCLNPGGKPPTPPPYPTSIAEIVSLTMATISCISKILEFLIIKGDNYSSLHTHMCKVKGGD